MTWEHVRKSGIEFESLVLRISQTGEVARGDFCFLRIDCTWPHWELVQVYRVYTVEFVNLFLNTEVRLDFVLVFFFCRFTELQALAIMSRWASGFAFSSFLYICLCLRDYAYMQEWEIYKNLLCNLKASLSNKKMIPDLNWVLKLGREDLSDTLRILVATDCHLGYMEKDEIRRHDSFKAFDEICSIAEEKQVSFSVVAMCVGSSR